VWVGRHALHVDSVDRWLAAQAWRHGWLEADERALIRRVVRPGMVAIDVGANVGLHTLELAACVGPGGRVVAVEAEPRNARLLARTVAGAGVRNVRIVEAAATDRTGPVTIHVSAANRGDHRLTPDEDPRAAVPVPGVVLDDVLAGEPHVDFVKLDVQGAELAVLRGLRRTLAQHAAVGVLCELSPDLLRRAGTTPDAVLAELAAHGLVPHALRGADPPEPMTAAAAVAAAAANGHVNLYCRRPRGAA